MQSTVHTQEQYLFPVLLNGPFNQMRDIRAFAALAQQLGAKLMLTGIFKHHVDMKRLVRQRQLSGQTDQEALLNTCFADQPFGYMPFTDVLDRYVSNAAAAWRTPELRMQVLSTILMFLCCCLRQPFGSAPTVEELKGRGWDGHLGLCGWYASASCVRSHSAASSHWCLSSRCTARRRGGAGSRA